MKKIIVILIVCVIIILGVYLGKQIVDVEKTNSDNIVINSLDGNSEQNIIIDENNTMLSSNIKERGEIKTSGLYNYNGDMSYENDLMQNDMVYHTECSLYHKIITNMSDYNKYKERISISEMLEDDFNNTFLVIIADETLRRDLKETNLMIYDIFSDETTTYITMKQKDDTKLGVDQELLNNVFYAIVDKSQLRDNIIVTINKD